jgi:putative Holliday junction resolvase
MSKPDTGVILAIDPGDARVGLAVSDAGRTFAFPLEVVEAGRAVDRIRELIAEREIVRIVVGLPLTMRGEIGPQGARVRKFVERLRRAVRPIPIETLDERLTSKEADGILGERGRGAAGKERRDAVAASLLLERYLRVRANTPGDGA